MKRRFLLLAFMAALAAGWGIAAGGELGQARPAETAADPFAELLQSYPSEVVKTGPTCAIVRIELPPGVSAEEIPGLPAAR